MRHFLSSLQRGEEEDALSHISSKHLLPVTVKIVTYVRAKAVISSFMKLVEFSVSGGTCHSSS